MCLKKQMVMACKSLTWHFIKDITFLVAGVVITINQVPKACQMKSS